MMRYLARTSGRRSDPLADAACPNCGEALIAPEWVAYVGDDLAWNMWSCDTCGHWLETRTSLVAQPRSITIGQACLLVVAEKSMAPSRRRIPGDPRVNGAGRGETRRERHV